MDINSTPTLRRPEDIALDLLKLLASHANIKPGATAGTPGFGVHASPKTEDAVTQLLQLYARCREAVETPISPTKIK